MPSACPQPTPRASPMPQGLLRVTVGSAMRDDAPRCYAGDAAFGAAGRVAAPAAIVFPPSAGADGMAARNVDCTVLMRLRDGTLRMLRLAPTAATRAALVHIDERLARGGEQAPEEPTLRRLAGELGVPVPAMLDAPLDHVDAAAWGVQRAAVAASALVLARSAAGARPEAARAQAEAIERQLAGWLEDALAAFVTRLDPDACAVACAVDRLRVDVYNFLVRGPHPAWRRQFARTYPLLVPIAATGGAGSSGADLRRIVDGGLPLARHLAARWAVSPAAVRCLNGRSIAQVGARWLRHPHQLVRILDALRAEDRPGADPQHWRRLADAVDAAEAIFRRPATSCPVTLRWLRQAARRGFAGAAGADSVVPPEAMAAIDALRAALVDTLSAASGGDETAREATAAAVDRHLARLAPAQLASWARSFAREHARCLAAASARVREVAEPSAWPLLPQPLLACEGTRRVVALTSRAELRNEGRAQALCIAAGGELAQLVRACAAGDRFVLSIRHADTGARLSTAEVQPVRRFGSGTLGLRVLQHKAHGNRPPSSACARALREALAWAASPQGRAHFDAGRGARPRRADAAEADARRDGLLAALRAALGADRYDRLASEASACGAASARGAGTRA